MRKRAFAERTRGRAFGLLAVVNGVGIAHGFCPLGRICIRTKRVESWMISGDPALQRAVRNCRGYSEKIEDLSEVALLCPVKTAVGTFLKAFS